MISLPIVPETTMSHSAALTVARYWTIIGWLSSKRAQSLVFHCITGSGDVTWPRYARHWLSRGAVLFTCNICLTVCVFNNSTYYITCRNSAWLQSTCPVRGLQSQDLGLKQTHETDIWWTSNLTLTSTAWILAEQAVYWEAEQTWSQSFNIYCTFE